MQRGTFLAASAGAFALPLVARAQSARTLLRIGFIPTDVAAQPYYARELGLFEKAGFDLQLTPLTNGAGIMSAVTGGSLDIGQGNIVALAAAHERGLTLSFLCATNYYASKDATTGIVVVDRDADIHGPKDLDGKIVAVSGLKEIAGLAVRNWIDAGGGDSTKVKFIELPFPVQPDAVRAKRIDAAAINRAFAPTAGSPGDSLRVIGQAFDSVAPRWVISGWLADNDWIAKHPDDARRFLGVMREATKWANANKHDAAQVLAKNLNQDLAKIEAIPRPDYQTAITPQLVQPGINLTAKYGLIKAPFPAQEIISTSATRT
jgi:NitT/TauT family transport system substrate-binding protein